jgi:hypothetical protein
MEDPVPAGRGRMWRRRMRVWRCNLARVKSAGEGDYTGTVLFILRATPGGNESQSNALPPIFFLPYRNGSLVLRQFLSLTLYTPSDPKINTILGLQTNVMCKMTILPFIFIKKI